MRWCFFRKKKKIKLSNAPGKISISPLQAQDTRPRDLSAAQHVETDSPFDSAVIGAALANLDISSDNSNSDDSSSKDWSGGGGGFSGGGASGGFDD